MGGPLFPPTLVSFAELCLRVQQKEGARVAIQKQESNNVQA